MIEKKAETGLSEVNDEDLISELMHRSYYELKEIEEEQEVMSRKVFPGNMVMIIRGAKNAD